MRPPSPAELGLPDDATFIVFDTETSGTDSNAVIVQLAWALCDDYGEMLSHRSRLWQLPPGVKVNWLAYQVHGLATEKCNRLGAPAAPELAHFLRLCAAVRETGGTVVAHNAAFDVRMVQQSARIHGVDAGGFGRKHVFCTMRESRARVGATDRRNKVKMPSNAELFTKLTGLEVDHGTLHDALADLKLTAASYARGKEAGWW